MEKFSFLAREKKIDLDIIIFFFSVGPYKNRCLLLRGTFYTLMCDIEKALVDFNQVLELDDSEENKKVCC